MKQGRGREYPPYGGMKAELDYLGELRRRVTDLTEDLPGSARSIEVNGYTIDWVLSHLIQGELHWVAQVGGLDSIPEVTTFEELTCITRDVLSGHTLEQGRTIGPFTCIGQVVRHLQWHWAYHSAQVGFLRKSLGYEYNWTFAEP